MGKNRKSTPSQTIPDNPTFINHVEEWSEGYGEYEEIFSEEDKEYIKNHLQTTTQQLFRIKELNHHYENGEMILDENPMNWEKGTPVTFHGEMKSFSKSEESVLEFGADTTNPLVIHRTNGKVENFPIDHYPHNYQWMKETLVPSDNWKVEKVTEVTTNDKYKLKHDIGGNIWYEERPIYIVDITREQ